MALVQNASETNGYSVETPSSAEDRGCDTNHRCAVVDSGGELSPFRVEYRIRTFGDVCGGATTGVIGAE